MELARWEMFDRLEGLPSERIVRMLARFTAVICDCLGAKDVTPELLMRNGKPKAKRQSAAAAKANRRALVAAHNASVK